MQDLNMKRLFIHPEDRQRLNDATLRFAAIAYEDQLRRIANDEEIDAQAIAKRAIEMGSTVAYVALEKNLI